MIHDEDQGRRPTGPTGPTGPDGRCGKLWIGYNADLQTLHREVEAGAEELGLSLEKYLDATSFWETPLRAGLLASKLPHAVEQLKAVQGKMPRATDKQLLCGGATSARYLRQLRRNVLQASRSKSKWKWLDTDKTTLVTAETEDAARRVVGATLEALMWVISNTEPRRAFVIGRPPGHHNGCDERLEALQRNAWHFAAHGGCIFNETAVAVRNLLAKRPGCKVVVLDLDAHFGDGTAWHFYEDPNVLCISLHLDQSDLHFFPFLKGKVEERGSGAGKGYTLNLPLQEGAGDDEAWQLLQDFAFPGIQEFEPEVLFLAFGFDGMEGDPCLAGLNLSSAFFRRTAARCCQLCGRIVCTLQGGYGPQATSEALLGVLDVLANDGPEVDEAHCASHRADQIKAVLANESTWWPIEKSFDYVPEGMRNLVCEDTEESDDPSSKRNAVQLVVLPRRAGT